YRDGGLSANRVFISGGLGWRNRGLFVDLTYVEGFVRDVHFPYRLADKANTFATLKRSGGTILATVGFKF
ncbi:MAG: aromatic hydrocarbon degradation protein, partial [Bacteroidota bacterium]|nr:aromatic hydrocarbon degradation protein [Bacteroidota bacterium]